MRLPRCATFEKIRHQADVALEHTDAGLNAASSVLRGPEQRRDFRYRNDIADKGRRVEAGDVEWQGIIRSHTDRRGIHQNVDTCHITGSLPDPVAESARELCDQRIAPVGIDV